MSFQDLIKFITQQAVQVMDTPKDIRKQQKQKKKEQQGTWGQHWFGLLPQAISMLFKKNPQ